MVTRKEKRLGCLFTMLCLGLLAGRNSLGYEIQVLSTWASVRGVGLALDANQQPHLAYSGFDGWLRYTYWDGAGWNTSTIPTDVTVNSYDVSTCFDSDGAPHVVYFRYGNVYHSSLAPSGWQEDLVASSVGAGETYPLEVLPGEPGSVHVFHHQGPIFVREAIGSSGTWTVRGIAPTSLGEYVAATRDDDAFYLAYGSDFDLWFASATIGGAWAVERVTFEDNIARNIDVAVDSLGNPAIAYSQSGSIRLARWNGATWQVETLFSYIEPRYGISLSFDANGLPLLAFGLDFPIAAGWPRGMCIASPDEMGDWQLDLVEEGSGVGYAPALEIDTSGGMHLAYFAGWDNELHYVYVPGQAGPIPEPATCALCCMSLLGLLVRRGRGSAAG